MKTTVRYKYDALFRNSPYLLGFPLREIFGPNSIHGHGSVSSLVICWTMYGLIAVTSAFPRVFTRLELTDKELIWFNMLNQPKMQVPYEDIVRYFPVLEERWGIKIGKQAFSLGQFPSDQVHRYMARYAPQALDRKFWGGRGVPPAQDFAGLWGPKTFRLWILFGGSAVLIITALITHYVAVLFFIPLVLAVSIDLLETFSVDSEGLTRSFLGKNHTIHWPDLLAVFHEKSGGKSEFIFVSETESIRIQSPLLKNPLLRRKLIYSIPKGTRCVNWKDISVRGKGKRFKLPSFFKQRTRTIYKPLPT